MHVSRTRTLRGIVCTVLASCCWAISGVCGQYLFTHFEISTLFVTCVRLLAGGAVLILLALPRHRRSMVQIWRSPKDAALLMFYGIFGLLLFQYAAANAVFSSNAPIATRSCSIFAFADSTDLFSGWVGNFILAIARLIAFPAVSPTRLKLEAACLSAFEAKCPICACTLSFKFKDK